MLVEHNRYRARHCAPPLEWSPELAETARQWASDLQSRGCPLQHSRSPHGENLAAGTAGTMDPEGVARLWYDEVDLYDFDNPDFAMETGHFTQLVWRSSRALGCAVASCSDIDVWVCHYSPAGNTLDRFADNVRPASCDE